MSNKVYSVYLIDDHPIVAAGLRLGMGLTEDFRLIGTAVTNHAALEALETLSPDVIITDLVIDGEVELEYIGHYRKAATNARVVVFSSLSREAYGEACFAAGADGFVSKSTSSPHELAGALKKMMENGPASGPNDVSPDQTPVIALEGVHLTRREAQIARDLAQGHSITAIADALGISKKTAAVHRDNLRGKLNCATSSELITLLARALKP